MGGCTWLSRTALMPNRCVEGTSRRRRLSGRRSHGRYHWAGRAAL